ncbi:putative DNA-binding pseudobarrel domain superfamily [Helianthus annuus]|nr:putative DNA-binding pseudobarrel domain superfamily [Helianthus annuus]KAJ0461311.1 putative DNA-binding pseudobarrel domain superfamily [Helianthus annuus]KAJ0641744.1 putative DNA-binding pseudobarrel domain superfamily [Helianthus annuus]KAJ0645624.1 putative DNA-binding pseudobarrel domain superfamily [Helianthus annuus]
MLESLICLFLSLNNRRSLGFFFFLLFFSAGIKVIIRTITVFKIMESSSSIREPSFCRIMNRADELLMGIPTDVAAKMWGVDKGPTNVLIETDDGRTFVVYISVASGKFFLFNGWSSLHIYDFRQALW